MLEVEEKKPPLQERRREEYEEQQDDIPVWNGEPSGAPTIGGHLSELQRQQLQCVLEKYERVLQAEPGKTNLTEHIISL